VNALDELADGVGEVLRGGGRVTLELVADLHLDVVRREPHRELVPPEEGASVEDAVVVATRVDLARVHVDLLPVVLAPAADAGRARV
jgi:H2-forming N5,N10-methylenetetrahydromethanopterin dehydrogenase-like enzyme